MARSDIVHNTKYSLMYTGNMIERPICYNSSIDAHLKTSRLMNRHVSNDHALLGYVDSNVGDADE